MTTRYALLLVLLFLTPVAFAQTWAPQTSGTGTDLGGVHFIDEFTGYAGGDEGVLLSTSDGGQTWVFNAFGVAFDLEGVAFNPLGTVGMLAVDDGSVFRTTDGGVTWMRVLTGAADLRHVSWADDTNVWVAGRESSAARSADAGETWVTLSTGSADRTESIAAVSAAEAWIVNRSGGIRHTTDGGATWASQTSGTGEDLNDIQMLDASTGYIAGSGSIVLRTTDSGATWTSISDGEAGGNGLFFLDPDTGWIVGDAGQIWYTADGGASWALQPSGTSAELSRVHFPDPNHGWAVGDGGVIVAFTRPTTDVETEAAAPPFVLTAPSPNPFSERTTLTLTVQAPQHVQVEVFDLLGRRLDVLHDAPLAAGATLSLTFDAAAWPSGLYVIRATNDMFSAMRRITLVR